MTQTFIDDLEEYRDKFTGLLHFNSESPKRIQGILNSVIKYLEAIKSNDLDSVLIERIDKAITFFKLAYSISEEFDRGLIHSNDLTANHKEPSLWYGGVIGRAEGGIDIILRFINDDE